MPEPDEPQLAHCARCRRLYVRLTSHVCEKCFDLEESDFSRIRDEIEKDPNLSVDEVAQRAQVTVACVFRMLDEGLIAGTHDGEDVTCGRCGSPAIGPRQRLCMECLYDLDRQLSLELNQARLAKKAREMKGTAHFVHDALEAKRRT
jgi:hypothetical protein